MKQLLMTIAVIALLASCNTQSTVDNQDNKTEQVKLDEQGVLKVYLDKKGKITSNGNDVSLEELDEQLKELKDKNGTVYYSRADVASDPPEESMKVIQLVVKHEISIKFYTDKTFKTPVKM